MDLRAVVFDDCSVEFGNQPRDGYIPLMAML
jgi:hypothetical protein